MPTLSNDPVIRQASAVVAASLGLSPDAVNIGTGDERDRGYVISVNEERPTHVVLTIRKPGTDLNQIQAEKDILSALSKLPPMVAIAQTVPDDKLAVEMVSKLKAATTDTSFNKKLLEWPGFNPEIVKGNWAVNDFAVAYVQTNAYGVEFNLQVPTDKNTDPKGLVEKIDANIKERLPAIRALLTERVEKYTSQNMQNAGKGEQEIAQAVAKAREAIGKLEIAINMNGSGGSISVALRSPEQAAANKTRTGDYKEPDNADALRATNPLHTLSEMVTEQEKKTNPDASPQLNKALARSFLFGGDKAMDVFPLIAGRRDIKSAIAKELLSATKKHPEKAQAFKEILESNLFKNHSWGLDPKDAGAAPASPKFQKDPKEADVIQVWIEVAKEKVRPTMQALAAMAQQPQANIPAEPVIPAIAPASFEQSTLQKILSQVPFVPDSWVGRTQQPATQNSGPQYSNAV